MVVFLSQSALGLCWLIKLVRSEFNVSYRFNAHMSQLASSKLESGPCQTRVICASEGYSICLSSQKSDGEYKGGWWE